jgi:hypothetical protein
MPCGQIAPAIWDFHRDQDSDLARLFVMESCLSWGESKPWQSNMNSTFSIQLMLDVLLLGMTAHLGLRIKSFQLARCKAKPVSKKQSYQSRRRS